MKSSIGYAVAAAVTVLAVSAYAAPPKPKISVKQAETAALKKFPGKIISSQYEHEDGRWQYAVVIQTKKGMYEVEVSSANGRILDSERTSAAEERREAAGHE